MYSNYISDLKTQSLDLQTHLFDLIDWDISQNLSDFKEDGSGFNLLHYLSMLSVRCINIHTVHQIAELAKDMLDKHFSNKDESRKQVKKYIENIFKACKKYIIQNYKYYS